MAACSKIKLQVKRPVDAVARRTPTPAQKTSPVTIPFLQNPGLGRCRMAGALLFFDVLSFFKYTTLDEFLNTGCTPFVPSVTWPVSSNDLTQHKPWTLSAGLCVCVCACAVYLCDERKWNRASHLRNPSLIAWELFSSSWRIYKLAYFTGKIRCWYKTNPVWHPRLSYLVFRCAVGDVHGTSCCWGSLAAAPLNLSDCCRAAGYKRKERLLSLINLWAKTSQQSGDEQPATNHISLFRLTVTF